MKSPPFIHTSTHFTPSILIWYRIFGPVGMSFPSPLPFKGNRQFFPRFPWVLMTIFSSKPSRSFWVNSVYAIHNSRECFCHLFRRGRSCVLPLVLRRARIVAWRNGILVPEASVHSLNGEFTATRVLKILASGLGCFTLCRVDSFGALRSIPLVRPSGGRHVYSSILWLGHGYPSLHAGHARAEMIFGGAET